MTARDIGFFIACAEHTSPVNQLRVVEGMAEKMASADSAPVCRLLCKVAHEAMVFSDQGHTAPAMHLKLASEQGWSTHLQDISEHVAQTIHLLEPMAKEAFAEMMDGAGAGARALAYGSVGAGAGAGALYWLLNRHANEEDAALQAKKKQIDYYHNLGKELNESMRRKYHYDSLANGPEQQEAMNGR